MPKYKLAALGGTFDRLHHGHHHLLEAAFDKADNVIIGVTNDNFPHTKKAHQLILPFSKRLVELKDWIKKNQSQHRTQIIPIIDTYGPTLTDDKIEALAVTHQTLPGAEKINKKRKHLNLSPLPVVKAKLINDQEGNYLSSTRIRQGLVNRRGHVHSRLFDKDFHLTQNHRHILKNPQGELITYPTPKAISKRISTLPHSKIVLVGDVATGYFLKHQLPFNFAVFDNLINRRPSSLVSRFIQPESPVFDTKNPPGLISKELVSTIHHLLDHHHGYIRVKGEEDLAVLPFVMLLPLGSVVIYGQPSQGLVLLPVSESSKEKYRNFILKS